MRLSDFPPLVPLLRGDAFAKGNLAERLRKQHEIGIARLTNDSLDLVHNLPAHNLLKNVYLERKKKRAAELSFFGNLGEIA